MKSISRRLQIRIPTDSPAVDGSWTAAAAIRRMREIGRGEGLRTLWFKVAGELGYRRVALYELPLQASGALADRGEASIEPLGPADLEEYVAFHPYTTPDRFRLKLERGQRGLAVRADGRLAATAWASIGSCTIAYLLVPLSMRPDEAMLEVFTDPQLRGQGYATAVCAELQRRLQRDGVVRTLAAIVPENSRSRRLFARLGYRRVGTVRAIRVGRHRRTIVSGRCGIEAGAPGAWPART